jgi:hypothetical protein
MNGRPLRVRGAIRRRLAIGLGLGAGLAFAGGLALRPALAPPAPETAAGAALIPFNHELHAGKHRIDCLFCHGQAAHAATANLPALRDCYVCHWSIASDEPAILELERQLTLGLPTRWPSAVRLPAHVRFRHEPHVSDGVACSACHGEVAEMADVQPVRPLSMGFCVDCHRTEGATRDCMACHQ